MRGQAGESPVRYQSLDSLSFAAVGSQTLRLESLEEWQGQVGHAHRLAAPALRGLPRLAQRRKPEGRWPALGRDHSGRDHSLFTRLRVCVCVCARALLCACVPVSLAVQVAELNEQE